MNRKFFSYSSFAAVILVGMYFIWPLPFQSFTQRIFLPGIQKGIGFVEYIISPLKIFTNVNNLVKENKSLEEENQKLKSQISLTGKKQETCSLVQNELDKLNLYKGESVLASVVGRSPETANQYFIINKGSESGVNKGQVVISNGYMVGVIENSNPETATVKLISSNNSAIPAVLSNSKEIGLVQGGIEGLSLTEISSASRVQSGESVLTSGIGSLVPEGIQIGQISDFKAEDQDIFQSIRISTPVKFAQIKIVSVLR